MWVSVEWGCLQVERRGMVGDGSSQVGPGQRSYLSDPLQITTFQRKGIGDGAQKKLTVLKKGKWSRAPSTTDSSSKVCKGNTQRKTNKGGFPASFAPGGDQMGESANPGNTS